MKHKSDEELMMLFGKSGKHAAFAELYGRHKAALYRYFVRQLNFGQQEYAEELYQETWQRIIENKAGYVPTAKFTTWLYRIAHNLLIDQLRKNAVREAYVVPSSDSESRTCGSSEDREKQAIDHCISKLPLHQKEVFMLRYESDFNPAQICDIVDAKPEAIKTRLRYALAQLRKCLTLKLGDRA